MEGIGAPCGCGPDARRRGRSSLQTRATRRRHERRARVFDVDLLRTAGTSSSIHAATSRMLLQRTAASSAHRTRAVTRRRPARRRAPPDPATAASAGEARPRSEDRHPLVRPMRTVFKRGRCSTGHGYATTRLPDQARRPAALHTLPRPRRATPAAPPSALKNDLAQVPKLAPQLGFPREPGVLSGGAVPECCTVKWFSNEKGYGLRREYKLKTCVLLRTIAQDRLQVA